MQKQAQALNRLLVVFFSCSPAKTFIKGDKCALVQFLGDAFTFVS